MLVYQDKQPAKRRTPPPGVDGVADLLCVECREGKHRWWGIQHAHLIGPRTDWIDLDDGWQVAVVDKITPQTFRRDLRWCRTVTVEDTAGRAWAAPVILSEAGDRIILVAYGRDFLPVLTPAQERAAAIATAARQQLLAAQEMGDGIDFTVGARWTAELLSLTHHISMETLAALHLIDEALILAVLQSASALTLKKAEV